MAKRIKVIVGDRSWIWSLEVPLTEAFAIKSETGLAVLPFLNGIAELDPDCCQTLVWMLRRNDGETNLARKDVLFSLLEGFTAEDLDEEVPTPVPVDVTEPPSNGTTRPSGTSGSSDSDSTATSPPALSTV